MRVRWTVTISPVPTRYESVIDKREILPIMQCRFFRMKCKLKHLYIFAFFGGIELNLQQKINKQTVDGRKRVV